MCEVIGEKWEVGETAMNPVVNAQMKAFETANPNTGLEESELFEVFSIFSVCNGILTNNIDPFAVHLKGNEFGLDGVAIIVQGELCRTSDDVGSALSTGKNHDVEFNLFQAKTSENIDYGDLSKFFDAAYTFFKNTFVDPTDQLNDLIAAKDALYAAVFKRNPTLRLFFAATGSSELSKQIGQLLQLTKTRLVELNIFEDVEIQVLGAKELQSGYRSATNSISGTIEITNPITLPEHPSVQQAFLGLVDAQQLVKLATVANSDGVSRRMNRGVFFDNVRDFDDKSKINISILDELKNGGQQSFVFKNNGVTVVAKEISRKNDTFILDDFQIVNGCQTSNILFAAGVEASGVSVPFRLIGSNDPDFVSSIIIGTNKQNEIRDDQFWSLLPFMKNLEEYCREQIEETRIFIERRENQYRDVTVERKRICKPRELVKAIAAMFLFQPHRAARDYRGVSQEFSEQIFQDQHSVIPYHAAAFAAYRLDFAVRNGRVQNSHGIFKYFALSAIGHKFAEGKKIFSKSKKEQDKIGRSIIEALKDEVQLIYIFNSVAEVLNDLIVKQGITEREKIRDFIRNDSVNKNFEAVLGNWLVAKSVTE